jgi:hypothetical protein
MANIVGEWKLDGDANDTWGSNNGSTLGTTSSSDCIYGTCLSFAGGSQYVDFGTNSSLVSVFDNNKSFSYAVWFYPTSLQSNWGWVVCKAYTSHVSPHYQIELRLLSTGKLQSFIYNNTGAVYLPSLFSNTISLNTWNFAVVSIDLVNNTHKLYVNGVLFGPTSGITGTYANHASPLVLGSNRNLYTSSVYNFIGKMDEFRLYNAVVPAMKIKEQYYAELNSLLSSGQIDLKEYTERINSIAQQ